MTKKLVTMTKKLVTMDNKRSILVISDLCILSPFYFSGYDE